MPKGWMLHTNLEIMIDKYIYLDVKCFDYVTHKFKIPLTQNMKKLFLFDILSFAWSLSLYIDRK